MVDTEKIKGALDSFENDDFLAAKEELSTQIKSHMNDYFKDKLELTGDVIEQPKAETKSDDDDDKTSKDDA